MFRVGVFFDRDGVLNINTHYPHLVEDCYLAPEVSDTMTLLSHYNWVTPVVISNQGGVGKGLFSKEDSIEFESELRAQIFNTSGLLIPEANWYRCYSEEDSNPFRKPNPGMLLQAAKDHNIDLRQSAVFGDKSSDLIAGARAGCCALYLIDRGTPSLYDQVNSFMGVMDAKRRTEKRQREARLALTSF